MHGCLARPVLLPHQGTELTSHVLAFLLGSGGCQTLCKQHPGQGNHCMHVCLQVCVLCVCRVCVSVCVLVRRACVPKCMPLMDLCVYLHVCACTHVPMCIPIMDI